MTERCHNHRTEPAVRAVDIDPDKCSVGRALVNDELKGWLLPCPEEPTEECVLPNGLILPFCAAHGEEWREAIIQASIAVSEVQAWEERMRQ